MWQKTGDFTMCWTFRIVALAAVAGFASAAHAQPGGLGTLGMVDADASIVLVGGCHRDEEVHFVPEVNRSLAHVHIGDDCAPYRLSDSSGNSQDEDDYEDDESADDDYGDEEYDDDE
jgi:hypothetical protein